MLSEDINWLHQAQQDKVQWEAFVAVVMNIQIPLKVRCFFANR